MNDIKIIEVDDGGIDSEGNEYINFASDEMVEAGHFVNVPVKVKYPNGSLVDANEVMVTKSGIEFLRQTIPAELRYQ